MFEGPPKRGARWEADYASFVRSRTPALRSTAYVLCGDWHRADDLLQTTLLKLYLVWPRLVRHGELDGYARRVLVRAFLHENRRKWRSREHSAAELPDIQAERDPDHEQRMVVRAALASVPPKQRAVLVLRYWNDLSVEDTAAALGCSEGNVKSQSARGLSTLRKALKGAYA
ncbi:SigE family RNA polymerase sigma factor [Kibdelosporangium philippinense]|uniref:SigE family RNA polymerase sigma factor n=1 Tax=Kibdelosporangium philippinense TaxID=211113 RepID=A0ABS8ZRG9_9PSEU|nr:SigE family RNA polymerase sigma factor [Kibdelosporangium philippinense]MCE7010179.1 SigE family RNA polymerase sigma factor [Kibdelosporangium philippinense]